MQDGSLLLHLLHAALMVSSMMLTWQVHRLRKPKAAWSGPSRDADRRSEMRGEQGK